LPLARAPTRPSLLRQQKFAFEALYSATLACNFSQGWAMRGEPPPPVILSESRRIPSRKLYGNFHGIPRLSLGMTK
jgi:hypothetical protein